MKEKYIRLLKFVGRQGTDNVIANLEMLGFFEAPASTVFHLNRPGGLLEHSLNVNEVALALREQMILFKPELRDTLPQSSVILVSLLHDVCKAEIYRPAIKRRKTESGQWVDYEGYDVDYSAFPLGHGEKSVIRLLRWGMPLTDDEIMAIRWHMAPWDLPFQSPESKSSLTKAKDRCPLLSILQAADGLASHILER